MVKIKAAFLVGPYNESLTTELVHVRNEVVRTRHYQHAGVNWEDVSEIADGALMSLMKDALRVWNEELGGGVDYDTAIITGGGRPVIGPLLTPQLNHYDARVIPEGEAHLANALGALRHRKFKREYMQAWQGSRHRETILGYDPATSQES